MRAHIRCLLLIPAFTVVAGAQDATEKGARLASVVDADLKQRATEGWSGAVIVEYKGAVVLRNGYGFANRERKVPFTTRTIAQVGSLTKQFTAAAVVALARERRLAVTDSIAKYLPEVRGAARSLTLHELLTHASGMPQYCGQDFDLLDVQAFIARCVNNVALKTRGSYGYSNPGYSILGIIVERVSGQRLEEFQAATFFRPLGLSTIAYEYRDQPPQAGPAVCYMNDVAQQPINERISGMRDAFWALKGNGGLQASTEDMYRWYRALRSGPVLQDDMRKLLLAPHQPRPEPPGSSYSYGWNIRVDSAGSTVQVSHTGSDGACYAAFIWRPLDDGFIYLVGNTGDRATQEAASALLRIFREVATAKP